jgi:hypothetical protein
MAGNSKTSKSVAPSKAQGSATRYTGGKNASVSKQTKAMGRVGGGNKPATVQSSAQKK